MVDADIQNIEEQQVDEQKESRYKVAREISVDYPYYSLDESIDFVKKIYSIAGRSSISVEMIASSLSVKTNSNSFTYSLSSARQFGLITKNNDQISLTEKAKQIIVPSPDFNVDEILKELVQSPPLYKTIIDKYEGLPLPEQGTLSNVLFHEGVVEAKKTKAAISLIKSLEFSGIMTSDRIIHNNSETMPEAHNPVKDNGQNVKKVEDKKIEYMDQPASPGQQILNLALANNRCVKIALPSDINHNEVERLKKVLDNVIVE